MNYQQALTYLNSLKSPIEQAYTPGFHLERMRKVLSFVGNPQDSYKSIHIGGTAGKGSTSYATAKLLASMGYKVGVHLSPHFTSYSEKFKIFEGAEERQISEEDFAKIIEFAKSVYENPELEILGPDGAKLETALTFYETIIFGVFEYFKRENVDVAVVEVALGGRYDATNVIHSDVSILTNVGLDHKEILGDTREKILKDKMYILERGSQMISGLGVDINEVFSKEGDVAPKTENAFSGTETSNEYSTENQTKLRDILGNFAQAQNSQLLLANRDFEIKNASSSSAGIAFDLNLPDLKLKNLSSSILGSFQILNISLAIAAVWELIKKDKTEKGTAINPEEFEQKVRETLTNMSFRGRFEIAQKQPPIIFDGAHNPKKMSALVNSINQTYPGKRIDLLFNSSKTKDISTMVEILKNLDINQVYVCEFTKQYYKEITSWDAQTTTQLIRNAFPNTQIHTIKDPLTAFKTLKTKLAPENLGLVTGSLYLLGEVY